MIILETERLILREWQAEDIDNMAAINSDAEVMKYFPGTQTRAQTEQFIKRMLDLYEKEKFCYFALTLKSSHELIGFTGLSQQTYDAPFTPCTDIGWRLKTSAWGQGYATEAARAALGYGIRKIGLKQIFAVAPEINTASIRIMEKIGMTQHLCFKHPALTESPKLENCVCYLYQE